MHASFTRSLAVVGLLAMSLTGCQSSSLGKFSWKPKWPSFGRHKDTAVASNATTGADSTAGPWLPSQQATPGYGAPVANSGYGVGGQYNTGYAGMPTSYTGTENSQGAWGMAPATGSPTAPNTQYDAAAYAAAPTAPPNAPQVGYYDYNQQPTASSYPQQPQAYGPPAAAAPPAQQATNSWDPGAQYGPAPSSYSQPQQYGAPAAPAAQLADNSRYPAATQYDGGQQYSPDPNATPTGYESAPQQEAWPPAQQGGYAPATQSYPQYQQQPAAGPNTTQPYRPGGTSDYNAAPSSSVTPANYNPSPYGAPAYPQ